MAGQTLKVRAPTSFLTISEALEALSRLDAPGLEIGRLVLELQNIFERAQVSRGVSLFVTESDGPHARVVEPPLPDEILAQLTRSVARPFAGEMDVVALPRRFRVWNLGNRPEGGSVLLALEPGPSFRHAWGALLNLALSLLKMKVASMPRVTGERAEPANAGRLESLYRILRALEPVGCPDDLAATLLSNLPSYVACDLAGILVDTKGRWSLNVLPVSRCSDGLVAAFVDELLSEHASQVPTAASPEPCEIRTLPPVVNDESSPLSALQSRVSLPIITRGGQIVGRLVVASANEAAFGEPELAGLATLVSHLAFAVENRRQLCELERQASLDGMTELYNYRTFRKLLTSELSRATRYQKPMSLVLLDIDHFKQINDTYGHPRGDSVLKKVARLLLKTKRQEDMVARYGGEEFALILPETNLEGALLVAERIRQQVDCSRIVKERPVTISLGVVAFDGQRQCTEDRLIGRADGALYQAKRAGRNCVKTA